MLLLFSSQVVSNSSQPHGLQHARLPCPSSSPWICPSWWICGAIQPSHPLSPASPSDFSLSQHQGLFQWVSCLHQEAKVLELQLQSFQRVYSGLISFKTDWFDLPTVRGMLKSLLQHHSLKASILWCSGFFIAQLSHPYMTSGKTIAWSIWTFIGKVMSLLFSTLSRFVITFLPRGNRFPISWLQSPSAVILEPRKRKSITAPRFSPSVRHEVMGLDAMILVSLIFSFKLAFSPSFVTLIKRLFSSFLLSTIRVVSSTYLKLILSSNLDSSFNPSSPEFHMMCSVYKLNKQGDNKQPCHTPFSNLNQSVVPYRVLMVASWPAYRFLRRQVKMV